MSKLLFTAASFLVIAAATSVSACGGDDPSAPWSLDRRAYERDEGLPFLSPGNDSRINLLFLIQDANPELKRKGSVVKNNKPGHFNSAVLFDRSDLPDTIADASPTDKKHTTFNEGEGTRCLSAESGKQDFLTAVQNEPNLSPVERQSLIDARTNMSPECEGARVKTPVAPFVCDSKASDACVNFSAYLNAASAFYDGDYDKALIGFKTLASANNAWLRETALYMTGRTLLNKAATGAFNDISGVAEPVIHDKATLSRSETEFHAYLDAYPSGRYAASARGLLRRVYWLAGDKSKLANEYSWLIAHPADAQANLNTTDLVQEIDAKYLASISSEIHDPILLAAEDLMRMRLADPHHADFSAAAMEQQAKDFAGHDDLFAYLKAARAYYVDNDSIKTLELLGPARSAPLPPSNLAFSHEILRGQALMAARQTDAAIAHWRLLLPSASEPWQKEAVELGLAMSWEHAGTIDKAFLPETRIHSERIRGILLQNEAGPILLRMAVADPQSSPRERVLAQRTLLFKEATRSHYDGFLHDYDRSQLAKDNQEPDNSSPMNASTFLWAGQTSPYPCPKLEILMMNLAKNPDTSQNLLCLGEFVRSQSLDSVETEFQPKPDELGGGKSIFPGKVFARSDIYKRLIANPATPDRDRAYALYRAINCYATSGRNTCGGSDVNKAQRKAWFDELKARYGATDWARNLRYYW
jgi:TolA-binding protein